MKILALDSSGIVASVAIVEDDVLSVSYTHLDVYKRQVVGKGYAGYRCAAYYAVRAGSL